MQYSAKFKERMISKLTGPGARSATALAKEVDVSQATLSKWLRQAKVDPMTNGKIGRSGSGGSGTGRRRGCSPETKVRLVMEAAAIGDEELGAFLRREGLHEADLERFREEVQQAAMEGLKAKGRRRGALSAEEKELRSLRKELARKDKALAETAALLVLRGKVQAFLSGDEEGDTNGRSEK